MPRPGALPLHDPGDGGVRLTDPAEQGRTAVQPPAASTASRSRADIVLDLRGLWCPQPVLKAKRALRDMEVGGAVVLECTDPLTVIDVPHFCGQTGHVLTGQERLGDLFVFRIVKSPKKPNA